MRSRTVFSAFPKPTHLCSKSSFSLFAPSLFFSLFFSLCLLWPKHLSQLSPIISPPLLCSFTFLSILFSDIPSAVGALLFPPKPAISALFLSRLSFDSFFFHLKFCAISHFLPFGVLSPLLLFFLFHFPSHVSIFSTLNHSHPFILCTFLPVGCLKRLL